MQIIFTAFLIIFTKGADIFGHDCMYMYILQLKIKWKQKI